MTTGLVAPDGIVGVHAELPGRAPRGATAVMYTEKELNYYLAGDSTNAIGTAGHRKSQTRLGAPGSTAAIDFIASPYISENMPSPGVRLALRRP